MCRIGHLANAHSPRAARGLSLTPVYLSSVMNVAPVKVSDRCSYSSDGPYTGSE